MKGPLLCLLFVYAIGATEQSGLYEGFKNGFSWHGVDIVIDDERYAAPSLETPGLSGQTIKDTQIFNILGQTLGTPLIDDHNGRLPLNNVNLFSRPEGHFFFVLEGFTDDMLPTTSFRALRKTPTNQIKRTSRPYYPQATLATAVTAQQPAKHGVFHRKDDLESENIFDLVNHLYRDTPVYGASLSRHASTILAPHEKNTFYWCKKTSSWKGASEFTQFNADELLQQFSIDKTFSTQSDSRSIHSLVAELAFVLNAVKVLPSSFFFSFHFQSPQWIASQFGASSSTFAKAIELIDRTIEIALTSRPAYSILYLPALHNEHTKEVKSIVAPLLKDKIDGHHFFPRVRLNKEALGDKQQICHNLRQAISDASLENVHIFCALNAQQDKKRSAVSSFAPAPPAGNSTGPIAVYRFHTFFWVFPLLIIGLFWALYAIAFIEPDVSMEESASYVKALPSRKME